MNQRGLLIFPLLLLLMAFLGSSAPPPYEPGVFLDTPVYSTDDAVCEATYSSVESADGDVSFQWLVETVEVHVENYAGLSPGDTVSATLDSDNYSVDDGIVCNVTVQNNDGVNYSDDNTLVETDVPEVSDLNFYNYSDEHAFNLTAVVYDDESNDDIQACRVKASNGTKTVTFDMSMDTTYGDRDQLQCFYSNISENDFPVLETLDVEVFALDTVGNEGNITGINTVPNSPPEIFGVRPEDDSRTSGSDIELVANFIDDDGENIDMNFSSSQASPKVICDQILNQGTVECTWNDLDSLKDYKWTVNASDGYQTVSEQYSFRNIVSSQVKAVTGFDHRYSSIVMSTDSSQTVFYRVENNHDNSKQLTSKLDGLNSEFVESSSDQISYALSPDSSRSFEIRVSPTDEGSKTLNVTTENDNFDITNKDSIEVFVRNQRSNIPEVPGIGLLQVLLIFLASTLYYSERL